MRKLLALSMALAATLTFTSCEETVTVFEEKNNLENGLGVLVENNITASTTWSSDSVYVLAGRIAVTSGAILTIEAGTIIKGQAGTGANATALIVAQGAKLMAMGTATAPIIMTSIADEITPGSIDSPNLSDDIDGLWGGLIVLGKAPIFVANDNPTANVEGIPATDANGIYGGSDNTDNSGSIEYVSLRHGGSNIGEGNEINGITFGGVGNGTTVSYVEVIANQDDGVEFFGGSVNVSNVLVMNNGDDAIDTDQGYSGTITNGMIINPGDKAFELDGGEGSNDAATSVHMIKNFSVILDGAVGSIDVDDDTNVTMDGIWFYGLTEDTGTAYDMRAGKTGITNTFTNIQIASTFLDGDDVTVNVTAGTYLADVAGVSIVATGTVGATKAAFTGWTFASLRGAF